VFVEVGGDEEEAFRGEVEGEEGMRIAVDGEAPGPGIVWLGRWGWKSGGVVV
jgi:hypothetical protein